MIWSRQDACSFHKSLKRAGKCSQTQDQHSQAAALQHLPLSRSLCHSHSCSNPTSGLPLPLPLGLGTLFTLSVPPCPVLRVISAGTDEHGPGAVTPCAKSQACVSERNLLERLVTAEYFQSIQKQRLQDGDLGRPTQWDHGYENLLQRKDNR